MVRDLELTRVDSPVVADSEAGGAPRVPDDPSSAVDEVSMLACRSAQALLFGAGLVTVLNTVL